MGKIRNIAESVVRSLVPDAILELGSIGTIGKKLLSNPLRMLSAIFAAILLELAVELGQLLNTAVLFFTAPADAFAGILRAAGGLIETIVFEVVASFNTALIAAVVPAGPLAPVALLVLYVFEFWLLANVVMLLPYVDQIAGFLKRSNPL